MYFFRIIIERRRKEAWRVLRATWSNFEVLVFLIFKEHRVSIPHLVGGGSTSILSEMALRVVDDVQESGGRVELLVVTSGGHRVESVVCIVVGTTSARVQVGPGFREPVQFVVVSEARNDMLVGLLELVVCNLDGTLEIGRASCRERV